LETLETRDSIHIPAREPIVSQPQREDADLEAIREAEQILSADIRTHHLALELGREQNLPGMVEIPGWKFIVAARKFVGPGIKPSARRSFKYFASVAANATEDDRESASTIAMPCEKPVVSARLTPRQERSRIQDEAFARAAAELE
jgi:hypothetical protein